MTTREYLYGFVVVSFAIILIVQVINAFGVFDDIKRLSHWIDKKLYERRIKNLLKPPR